MELNAYLLFKGECEEAFRYYEKLLGGKIEAILLHEGTPMASHVPAEWRKKVMHASMTIGSARLMGSDPPPEHYTQPQGFSVTVGVSDPAEAERVFNALADRGQVKMPMQQTFWAQRFGMVVDRFGIPWMVNCEQAATGFQRTA